MNVEQMSTMMRDWHAIEESAEISDDARKAVCVMMPDQAPAFCLAPPKAIEGGTAVADAIET